MAKNVLRTFAPPRQRTHPTFVLAIMVMWCLLMGELTVANVVAGLAVGLIVVFALPLPAMPISGIHITWRYFFAYGFVWFGELIWASIKVAWLAIRPAPLPKNAIVNVPMRIENELILFFAVALYNLQPGGTVTDIDIANRVLTIHILDGDNEEKIRRECTVVTQLERRLIATFERSHR